jgi:hypothetical protein
MPISQQALEPHDTALTRFEKLSQLRQQGLERCENGVVIFQLIVELAAAAETLTDMKAVAQIRAATREAIECRERVGAEAACETGTRQA